MITAQFAAGLVGFLGLCLLAGWVTGFRNRSYVGWLGLAFVALAGFLAAAGKAREAKELGGSAPAMAMAGKALLVVFAIALVLSAIAAIRETSRRLREIKEGHLAAAEGLLEMMRAGQEPSEKAELPGGDSDASERSDGSDKAPS